MAEHRFTGGALSVKRQSGAGYPANKNVQLLLRSPSLHRRTRKIQLMRNSGPANVG